jgi:hypothetical protein
MDSSVSLEDRIWFLRVCHHVSNGLYFTVIAYIFLELLFATVDSTVVTLAKQWANVFNHRPLGYERSGEVH